ncbi:type 1 fimbrial protein [Paramixta manurensis]|uniref:Type 1 fimbrial protein n=1 Tax=Paramixta manurensis TaxID=2740817 RepID=A0A6M8U9N0_9GAMM|nr:type 1 fimbrial protein [Erwiniaceae bacterium PD-1]
MKNSIIAASIMALFGAANVAHAAPTGTITFNGELTANTCVVKVNGQGPSETVVLPTISINQLKTSGESAGKTNFSMELSDCSDTATGVAAFFEAGKDVNINGRLNNNLTDGAKLVSLQLLDGSNGYTAIKAGDQVQNTATASVTVTDGKATLPYAVQYYAEGATSAGKVVSMVDYSIIYK